MSAAEPSPFDDYSEFKKALLETNFTPRQLDELEKIIRRKKHGKSVDQAYIYAYRIPFIEVKVNQYLPFDEDIQFEITDDRKWVVIKVGISGVDNCAQRVGREGQLLSRSHRKLKIPGAKSIPSSAISKYSNMDFEDFVHEHWDVFDDMMFLLPADMSQEHQHRLWPDGIGLDVGTGILSPVPDNLPVGCYSGHCKLQARLGYRPWVLGKKLGEPNSLTNSLGESEWIVIPETLFQAYRKKELKSEAELIATYQGDNYTKEIQSFVIETISLTIQNRPDFKTLTFSAANGAWPRK